MKPWWRGSGAWEQAEGSEVGVCGEEGETIFITSGGHGLYLRILTACSTMCFNAEIFPNLSEVNSDSWLNQTLVVDAPVEHVPSNGPFLALSLFVHMMPCRPNMVTAPESPTRILPTVVSAAPNVLGIVAT
jgi:hypothetical protein